MNEILPNKPTLSQDEFCRAKQAYTDVGILQKRAKVTFNKHV